MDVMREQVSALLEQGLFDSASLLGCFLVAATNASPDVSSSMRAENMVLYADALFGNKEHRRALHVYKQAQHLSRVGSPARPSLGSRAGPLQSKQAGTPLSGGASSPSSPAPGAAPGAFPGASDAEVKLKIAKCHVALKEARSALTELESIPTRLRTLPMSLMLARLYHHNGYERAAVASYRDCLRQNPYALEAITALAQLGAAAKDIHPQLPQAGMQSKSGRSGTDALDPARWLPRLADAHCCSASHDYKGALLHLRTLGHRFPGNPHLQVEIARAEAALGRCEEAVQAFQKARAADPFSLEGMDEYALLLQPRRPDNWELNSLTSELLAVDSSRPQAWVTAGVFWQARDDPARALTYLDKAIKADDRHALAYLVKGNVALEVQRVEMAATAFRRALALRPDLRASQGLVQAYLSQERHKEALCAAREAIKASPQSAQALTLVGHVYAHHPEGQEKARKFYESALRHDASCVEAVLALADLHVAAQRYGPATELLQRYVVKSASDALHAKLGQVLAASESLGDALAHYQAALSINAHNEDARVGLDRVEKLLKGIDPDSGDAEDDQDGDDAEADQQDAEFFS